MKHHKKNVVYNPVKLFCFFSLISFSVIILCFLFSRGSLINHYFFYDDADTGMDFFHSLEYVRGRAPYDLYNTLYPPLANLLFFIIYRMVPENVVWNWATNFQDSLGLRGTVYDLRLSQATLVFYIVIVVIVCLITFIIFDYCLKSNISWGLGKCAAFCALISYGALYAYERGNIILVLVVALTSMFVLMYNSPNKLYREIAIISLAIAAGLKLYPAFFGILLLKRRRFAMALRAVIYGILCIFVPSLVFHEGIRGVLKWIKVVFAFGSNSAYPQASVSTSGVLHQIKIFLQNVFGITINDSLFKIIGYVLAIVLLICALVLIKEWESCMAIVFAIFSYQGQGMYALTLFLIPLFMFMRREKRISRKNILSFIVLVLFCINLPVFYTRGSSYPNYVVYQIALVVGYVLCVKKTIKAICMKLNSGRCR